MEASIMRSEAKKKSQDRWDALNTKRYGLKLNKHTDGDIIDFLDSTGNIMGTIRTALRLYMKMMEEGDE